ncbi:MAG: xanthine dehydrogenase family protein molybdopterin-binding subunit, partial [Acidimicrobiia bacterium]|nr:xanthine dehydrogenase family protein molybdopterin-binding subunit [Acidimicrobiia bacterium]
MTALEGSILGNAVLRREDPSLLTGEDKFYDDLAVEGLGYVHFVRSPFAHATLGSIDTSEAEGMDGVIGVWTADTLDMSSVQGFAMFPDTLNRPPLATGKVRFVGDIIAVVVADSRGAAADAAEVVFADYEPLPVVVDIEKALEDGAPVLFEDYGSNLIFETAIGAEEDPLEGAEHITEGRIVSQRLAGVPMEPNGCLAIPEGDHLTVWIPSQDPVAVRDAIVGYLGIDPANLRVAAPAVGGGFGSKIGAYVEHFITARLARELNRPLKWTEVRSESMVSMAHGRAMVMCGRLGLTSDGIITGFDADVVADAGAYPAIGAFLTVFTQTMIQGVYRIPKLRYHARSAATNTTFTAAYRGAGRPEATQLLERMMDLAADDLGIDPAEIRRRNFLHPDDFPLTTHGGANYDNGEYEKALNAALEAADYQGLLAEQAARRESGDTKQLGVGLCAYVEVTAPAGLHVEYGAVEINDDGSVTARVG